MMPAFVIVSTGMDKVKKYLSLTTGFVRWTPDRAEAYVTNEDTARRLALKKNATYERADADLLR